MLSNCPQCHKPYPAIHGAKLCQDCLREEQELYLKVYRFLMINPISTIEEVAEGVDVSQDDVLKLIRQSKIQMNNRDVHCGQCKNVLTDPNNTARRVNGRLICLNCIQELSYQIRSSTPVPSGDPAPLPLPGVSPAKSNGSGPTPDFDRRYGLGR